MTSPPRRPNLSKLAELSSLGLILPSSIAVGLFIGYFLDKWLGTHPVLLLAFTVLGIFSGLLSLVRALRRHLKDEPPGE
ncbi:MAG: AtpZ/AtpI family protein [Candidatus Aminicenantes bacterium]